MKLKELRQQADELHPGDLAAAKAKLQDLLTQHYDELRDDIIAFVATHGIQRERAVENRTTKALVERLPQRPAYLTPQAAEGTATVQLRSILDIRTEFGLVGDIKPSQLQILANRAVEGAVGLAKNAVYFLKLAEFCTDQDRSIREQIDEGKATSIWRAANQEVSASLPTTVSQMIGAVTALEGPTT